MTKKTASAATNTQERSTSDLEILGAIRPDIRPQDSGSVNNEVAEFEFFVETTLAPRAKVDKVKDCKTSAHTAVKRTSLIKPPIPWTREDPPMKLGNGFYGGNGEIHPMDFVHGAAFGATGSGKTVNVVMPFIQSSIQYELCDGTQSAVLVIDPKKELLDGIRQMLAKRAESDRLVVIGQGAPIQMFPADCALSASDRFDLLLELFPHETASDNVYWRQKAEAMLKDLMELELLFKKQCGKRFMAGLAKILKVPHASFKSYWSLVRQVLAYAIQGQKRLQSVVAIIDEMCEEDGVVSPSSLVFSSFTGASDTVEQACYVVMSAQAMVNALSDPSVDELVDLDVIGRPGRTSIQELVESAKVIVFQPESTTAHTFAARALKQRFFEAIYNRRDMRQPVFLAADEYQTFVSAKDTSLLDRSRGYRAVCLLSSQSLASLRHALGSNAEAGNVVEILVTNLPSRYTFRSNCVETVAWLKSQIPNSSEGPHILDVRRLATLRPGEAYFMQADGSWGFDRPSMPLAA